MSHDFAEDSSEGVVEEHTGEIIPAATPSRLLTRQEAARMLGVSETTLRRREAEGLRPTMRGRTHMYEETLVRQMTTTMRRRWSGPAPMDGGVAADVFALLAEGVAPRDVVIRLRVPPEIVGRLCSQWSELGDGFFVSGEDAAILGLQGADDVGAAVRRVAEVEAQAAASNSTCTRCNAPSTSICRDCFTRLQRQAYGHGVAGKVASVERRTRDDGVAEVRLVVNDCDVQNESTKRSMGGCTLTTEWEPEAGQFHWSRLFPGDETIPSNGEG